MFIATAPSDCAAELLRTMPWDELLRTLSAEELLGAPSGALSVEECLRGLPAAEPVEMEQLLTAQVGAALTPRAAGPAPLGPTTSAGP